MASNRRLNRPAARRLRDELLDGAVPIVFAGPLRITRPDGASQEVPFVQLDVGGHPDVAALFRAVHAAGLRQETSDAPVRYVYVDGHGYMETTLGRTQPVACHFKVVLAWPELEEVFGVLARERLMLLTVAELQPGFDWRDAIGVRIGPDLPGVLRAWEALRADGL